MKTLEEKIGYLVAKVEEQGEALEKVTQKLDALEEEVKDKFKTAEATLRVLKWVGAIATAAITLPWAQIKAAILSFLGK